MSDETKIASDAQLLLLDRLRQMMFTDETSGAVSDPIACAREMGYRAGWNDAIRLIVKGLGA